MKALLFPSVPNSIFPLTLHLSLKFYCVSFININMYVQNNTTNRKVVYNNHIFVSNIIYNNNNNRRVMATIKESYSPGDVMFISSQN